MVGSLTVWQAPPIATLPPATPSPTPTPSPTAAPSPTGQAESPVPMSTPTGE
jgi:hypothetical protein